METIRLESIRRSTLTVYEVAEYLGVSKDTVYIMAREKKIPHFKIGSRVLFKRSVIDKWVENQMAVGFEYEQ